MSWFIAGPIPLSYGHVTYTTVSTVTRLKAPARREQLLDATKAVVAEHGFHAASIETVARRAGITRPIVYRHFDDLGELLDALVVRETARALAQLEAFMPSELGDDPRQGLLTTLLAYLQAVESDPDTWRLVLVPPEGAPALLRERIALGRAAVVKQLAGAAAGSPDPELTARALSAVADEAARLVLADPERYPPARVLDHARWLLFEAARQTGLGMP
jgi:AcrR family transcriptional regulator